MNFYRPENVIFYFKKHLFHSNNITTLSKTKYWSQTHILNDGADKIFDVPRCNIIYIILYSFAFIIIYYICVIVCGGHILRFLSV